MQQQKSKPGPRATSCLTCRQRRKKCDLSRPFCDRCIAGKFECLGYGDDGQASGLQGTSNRLELRRIRPALPKLIPDTRQPIFALVVEPELRDSEPQDTSMTELLQDHSFSAMLNDPGPSALGIGLLHCPPKTAGVSRANNHGDLPAPASEPNSNSLWPLEQPFSNRSSHSSVVVGSPVSNGTEMRPDLLDIINNLSRIMAIFCGSVPRSVDSRPSMREGYISYVLTQYLMQRVRTFFQPPPDPFCHSVVARVKQSRWRATIWVMYLGAKLFQALDESPRDTAMQPYIHWIDQCDQQVARNTRSDPPIHEVEDRLTAQLELVFLKFVAVDCLAGYSLFRRSLPLFLQLVSTDSNLYVERCGNLVVSFSRALAAPQYEIRRFVVYDTMLALVLGLTPLVEYSYEHEVAVECQPSLEWVHGIPAELLGSIAQVNAWRSSTCDLVHDSQGLERRVLGWQPARVHWEEDGLATEGVARLAIQESWRHVALIYIYMGMCGVSSHDPRVQSSVQQIVKLLEVVSHSSIDIHLFIHCVVAGIAARYEKHRSILRAKLLSFQNSRIWFFRGTDFSKVLEYLWHNAGKNGAPVTWGDYLRSRRTILAPVYCTPHVGTSLM